MSSSRVNTRSRSVYSAEGGGGNCPLWLVRIMAFTAEASNCALPEPRVTAVCCTRPCRSTLTLTTQTRLTRPAEAKPQLGRTASITWPM